MKKIFVLVLGLTLLAAACNKSSETTEYGNSDQTGTQSPAPAPAPAPQPSASAVEIAMTPAGFSPATVTVKKGTVVTFKNTDTVGHWPASAPHPTHTDYPQFDPKKTIAAGQSWSFTFDKVGSWKYHDHLNATGYGFGAVTVVE